MRWTLPHIFFYTRKAFNELVTFYETALPKLPSLLSVNSFIFGVFVTPALFPHSQHVTLQKI